jgi:hypothetical protein
VQNLPGVEFIPLRIQDAFDRSWWQSVIQRDPGVDLDIDLTDESGYDKAHCRVHHSYILL